MDLLVGTVTLRPYVFAFLTLFLLAGAADLGWRRTLGFAGCVWPVAWLSEFSSTRIGVPFGLYHYTGATHGRELYIADVPLMDALSFTFLAYASFCLARAALSIRPAPRSVTAVVTGVLMMALDVVLHPLAGRGDRWVLGQVFTYAEPGGYFCGRVSHFPGGVIVGVVVLRHPAKARRSEALSAGAHARAVVPLQSRLRRLRQDPVPGADPEKAPDGRAVPRGGRRVRRADRLDSRRRAAHVSGHRAPRRGAGGAPQIRLPLHQRDPPERKARGGPLPPPERLLLHPSPRWAPRPARRSRLPRRGLRPNGGRDQGSARAGISRDHELDALRRREPAEDARVLRRDDGPGGRGHDDLAGLQLRQGAGSGALPARPALSRPVLGDALESKASVAVQPVAVVPPVPHGQAGLRVHTLGQPDLQRLRLAAALLPSPGGVRVELQGFAGDHPLGELRAAER